MPDKMLGTVNAMHRLKGFGLEVGDSFLDKYMPNCSSKTEGKVAMSNSCRTARINNDWIFTGLVK
jgi:hypothetical protein